MCLLPPVCSRARKRHLRQTAEPRGRRHFARANRWRAWSTLLRQVLGIARIRMHMIADQLEGILHRDLLLLWDGRRHHPMAALPMPEFIAPMRRKHLALCYTKARCTVESTCRRFLTTLRSCCSCGQREGEAMVPSWRFCMRGANALDIASVRIKIWVAVCTMVH